MATPDLDAVTERLRNEAIVTRAVQPHEARAAAVRAALIAKNTHPATADALVKPYASGELALVPEIDAAIVAAGGDPITLRATWLKAGRKAADIEHDLIRIYLRR
jgi:hypothetical protein